MTKSRWIIFAIICLVALGGLIFATKRGASDFSGDPFTVVTTGDSQDHVYGASDNKVVLIEYGDFQCPGCGRMYPLVKELKEKYREDLTFVFRNFPLTSIHPNALAAATAAEAAGMQGKFWEMHDKLYENQQTWENASVELRVQVFEGYAKELGLNTEQFITDLGSKKAADKIALDRATGKEAKASSTPTFYLNGQKIEENVWGSPVEFEKTLQEALTKATGKTYTPPAEQTLPSGGNE